MKKFINGRWFPLTAAILIVAAVALVMALFGWRITYAPELENSWDALSAVAALAGVIASFTAIMVAIRIPKKIADRQDKIALFEKRFVCFQELQRHLSLSKAIQKEQSIEKIKRCYVTMYCGGSYMNFDGIDHIQVLTKSCTNLQQVPFLFKEINETYTKKLYDTFTDLILSLANANAEELEIRQNIKLYTETVTDIWVRYYNVLFDSVELRS